MVIKYIHTIIIVIKTVQPIVQYKPIFLFRLYFFNEVNESYYEN